MIMANARKRQQTSVMHGELLACTKDYKRSHAAVRLHFVVTANSQGLGLIL